jgi:hypothetical protein
MKKITKKDILSGIKLKIRAIKSESACMECLPPAPLKDHKFLNGIKIHQRIDCPPDTVYMVNDDFKIK